MSFADQLQEKLGKHKTDEVNNKKWLIYLDTRIITWYND